jgi:sporulation protein YlmC with PRC-barrel domain
MRSVSGAAAGIAIALIAAAAIYGSYSDTARASRAARPAQSGLAQADAAAPAGQGTPENQPSAAPPAPANAPAANPPSGTPAVVIDDQEVSAILGKSVRGNAGEDMGRIVDVIVNHDGQVRAAVIDFGGFLGIGTRKIAVDWRALNFAPAGKPGTITLDLTRNQVRLAPEYKRGEPVVVLGTASPDRPPPSSEAAAPER